MSIQPCELCRGKPFSGIKCIDQNPGRRQIFVELVNDIIVATCYPEMKFGEIMRGGYAGMLQIIQGETLQCYIRKM